MIRNDGSVRSANLPVWDNRSKVRDYGLYRGFVHDVIYTDDDNNDSGLDEPNEVLYQVILIGGDRDGQIFTNVRMMRGLGGFSNFEEISLKKAEGVSKQDFTSPTAASDSPISNIATINGDVVYLQFLSGDPNLPVIVGLAFHQKADTEAEEEEAPRYRRKYNGIYTEITRDGEFTWSKDNGSYVPYLPNPDDALYPFVSQFAPTPGQEEAVKLSLDNEYNFTLKYALGLNVSISGTEDSFNFETSSGASVKLTGGEGDSFTAITALGTTLEVAGGSKDSISLKTAVGTAASVNGQSDEIKLSLVAGSYVSLSPSSGVQIDSSTGDELSLNNGAVALTNASGAKLKFDETGLIKFGNSSGDVLKDILQELIKSLSTATYAGYGAPGSNVADLTALLAKMALFTGG